jgi:hypothetical protein
LVKANGGSADLFQSASFRLSFYEEIHDKMKEIAAALPEDGHNVTMIIETTGAAPET